MEKRTIPNAVLAVAVIVALVSFSGNALAHCDTLDGPVVADARTALVTGDATPVLKWVRPDDEKGIRDMFNKTMKVRKQGPEAKEMADMYFFETLVRVHRAGEGFPYTGVKPAGTDPGPAVRLADQALETGSVDMLAKNVAAEVEKSIRERFAKAMEAKKHAAESMAAGREYVEAYVTYVHYVENLHMLVSGAGGHHGEGRPEEKEGGHGH